MDGYPWQPRQISHPLTDYVVCPLLKIFDGMKRVSLGSHVC
jgi:hypothetical protein